MIILLKKNLKDCHLHIRRFEQRDNKLMNSITDRGRNENEPLNRSFFKIKRVVIATFS